MASYELARVTGKPWCVNKITVLGSNAKAFGVDFMASFGRTNLGDDATSSMDGVFKATARPPPQQLPSHLVKLESVGGEEGSWVNPVRAAVGSSHKAATTWSVAFTSLVGPPYEEEELITISKAYPPLSIFYDYAEGVRNLFGRYTLINGIVYKASPTEMEGIKNSPLFRQMAGAPPQTEPKGSISVQAKLHRVIASGPNANVFQRDFLASFHRTKCTPGYFGAFMDGVFVPMKSEANSVSAEQKARSTAGKVIFFAKAYKDNGIEFMSANQRGFDQAQQTAISQAYPLLSFSFNHKASTS